MESKIIYAIALTPEFHANQLCLAATSQGLEISRDGGKTWQYAYTSLNLKEVLPCPAVAITPAFSEDRTIFAAAPGAIMRSQDAGNDWHAFLFPDPPPVVTSILISPNYKEDGLVLCGTLEDGIYRSADRGEHWNRANFGLLDLEILAMAISPNFREDQTIFVATETGLYKSTNGGLAWREVEGTNDAIKPADVAPILSIALAPDYANNQILFIGTEEHGLMKSGDGGLTWENVKPQNHYLPINEIYLANDYPTTLDILLLYGSTLLISHNDGKNWEEIPIELPHPITTVMPTTNWTDDKIVFIGLSDGQIIKINIRQSMEK